MSAQDRLITGLAASPGIAVGRAYIFDRADFRVPVHTISVSGVEREISRFKNAIEEALEEVLSLQDRISIQADEETSEIFRSHRAVLEDPEVIDVTIVRIRRELRNAEYIFDDIMQGWISSMSAVENPFFRERTADFEDVRHRVLARLTGNARSPIQDLDEPVVIIAHNLSPTDTAEIDRSHVCGFVTDVGGQASHTAIVARGLAVPAVVGTNVATTEIEEGTLLIVDGTAGLLYVDPSENLQEQYREAQNQLSVVERELLQFVEVPATTLDGKSVELSANIELPDEVEAVLSHGADGIGLYRTEFLFLLRHGLPSEEEQYVAYKTIAEKMSPRSVIIRTLDLGADKLPNHIQREPETNPALGFRGIRLCLENRAVFKVQLRAILRASAVGNLSIMFPMISRLSEVLEGKAVVAEVQEELKAAGVPFDENIPVGIMMEVPSAALTANALAAEADFFSIGTNDLIQYTLAADRGNTGVASIYDAYHPAILRLIDMVVHAGHENGIWVGVCGMMAGDPWTASLLMGLGLDELSMSPIDIPGVKRTIRSLSHSDLQEVAAHVLTLPNATEIHEYVKNTLKP